jgi:hypothetical protein
MSLAKFRNKDGSLNAYAFACGYIQTSPEGVRLLKDGCWHVMFREGDGERRWESCDSLGEARRVYAKMRREVRAK